MEAGEKNNGPLVLLPPAAKNQKIDLHVLLDNSSRAASYEQLIKANLSGLATYLFEGGYDAQFFLDSLSGSADFQAFDLSTALIRISEISFSGSAPSMIDGFAKISQETTSFSRSDAKKVMLIINATAFADEKPDGVTGRAAQGAIQALSDKNYLTFVAGFPFVSLHGIRSEEPLADFFDFSHNVAGGYLGSFGSDFSALVDLLEMQSPDDFVLQYFSTYPPSTFVGSSAELLIDDFSAATLRYQSAPSGKIVIDHIPENEIALGDSIPFEVNLINEDQMVNAVEVTFRNRQNLFETRMLAHNRQNSDADKLSYVGQIPSEDVSADKFTYYVSVHTPYTVTGAEGSIINVPVNIYDDEIILRPTLVNGTEVLWTWEGATVSRGKKFELWNGDKLITTTDKKNHSVPLDNCNRFQIMHVKVIFSDGSSSYPSRPVEYYADADDAVTTLTEKEGVGLMIECIETKQIDTFTKLIASTPQYEASRTLMLRNAELFMSKIIDDDIWRKIEAEAGYYDMLYYIMRFTDKEEYIQYGLNEEALTRSVVYKLITRVNQTADVNAAFDAGLKELASRLRGSLSF